MTKMKLPIGGLQTFSKIRNDYIEQLRFQVNAKEEELEQLKINYSKELKYYSCRFLEDFFMYFNSSVDTDELNNKFYSIDLFNNR